MAQKILGKQAEVGSVNSCTTEITVYPEVTFLGDELKEKHKVNFVDLPGLLDTENKDQQILDKMVEEFRKKVPRIDIFVLCFE